MESKLHLKVVMKITPILFFGPMIGAWTQSTVVKNTIETNTAAEERDYGKLFCENDEDARRATSGKIDWRRSNSDEYCRYNHKNDDDTWKSGWARSRLIRGCKWQLNFFGNEVYACYDRAKDPAILATQAEVNRLKSELYGQMILSYESKVKELANGINQTYGDVAVELDQAKQDMLKAQEEDKKARKQFEDAKKAVGLVLEQHSQVKSTVIMMLERFDQELKIFTNLVNDENQMISDLTNDFKHRREIFSDESMTSTEAIKLVENWKNLDKTGNARICKQSMSESHVNNLRDYIGFANKALNRFEEDLNKLTLESNTETLRGDVQTKIAELKKVVDDRSFIFDYSYDDLENVSLCDDMESFYAKADAITNTLKRTESLTRTTGVLVDLTLAIETAEREQSEVSYNSCISLRYNNLKSRIFDAISLGNVGIARTLYTNLDDEITKTENVCSSDLVEAKTSQNSIENIKTFKSEIDNLVAQRLMLSSASSSISVKLEKLKYRLLKIELKSKPNDSEAILWRTRKSEIIQTFNVGIGKDIPRPQFDSWSSLIAFERIIDRLNSSLNIHDGENF